MAIWPLWIPLTALLLEKIKKRKKTLILLAALGIIGSVSGVCLMLLFPVRAIPDHHHLHYHFDLSQSTKGLAWLFTILYLLATVVSLFISSLKRMKWLGIVFLVTYLVTLLVFPGFVVSAWCYFAAVLSIVVLWILTGLTRTENG
jgi:hypothetical protein